MATSKLTVSGTIRAESGCKVAGFSSTSVDVATGVGGVAIGVGRTGNKATTEV